jgi:hypothetical protein
MSDIVVADARPYVQYACDGAQTVFSYPFPILAATDLEVRLDDGRTPDGVSVSGVGESAGGTVTLPEAPAAGRTLTLFRDMAIERTGDFETAGAFRASAINAELDRLTMLVQQVEALAGQAVKRAPEDADTALVLPPAGERAGQLLGFDAGGLPALTQAAGPLTTAAGERARVDLMAVRARQAAAVPGVTAMPVVALDAAIGAGGAGVAVARSGAAQLTASDGTLVEAAANTARFDHDPATGAPLGLLCEGARTNLLHDSFNPVSQTRSLTAGTYTLSVRGTGSCALSGGPSGTASEGAPVTFALTGTTSVTFTVNGDLAAMQCEAGENSTSPIRTPAGGTAARAADTVALADTGWLMAGRGVSLVIEAHLADVPASAVLRLLSLDNGSEGDRHDLHYAAALSRIALFTKAGGVSQGDLVGLLGGWTDGSAHTIGITVGGGARALYVDGAKAGGDTVAEPTVTAVRLGRDHAGGFWEGHVRRFLVYPRALSDAWMTALTA